MEKEHIESDNISCSFCNKSRNEVDQIIEGPLFHNHKIYICNECVGMSYDILNVNDVEKPLKKKKNKIPSPEEIKKHLDEYIVAQDHAKQLISVAIYNHYKRIHNKSKTVEIDKSNVLMIGPSGSGKTLTIKTIAKIFDIPYVVADATTLTEVGYVGDDATTLVKRLIMNANGDIEKAQCGIIFIDEIDKKSKKTELGLAGRDVSGEGVQQSLLKLIEGTVLKLEEEYDEPVTFDTKNVLFICSGAFVGLDEIIKKNRSMSSIGIGANLVNSQKFSDVIQTVKPDDLIKYGLIPEFVGRCPVVIVFDDLTLDMMVKILKEPRNSIIEQFKALFKYENIELEFDDKYIVKVAEECIKNKVGARGLRAVIEKDLQATQFILPSLSKQGIYKIFVDSNKNVKYIYKAKKAIKK